MRNLHQLFDWQYIGQINGGDFAKLCGLLRIYELYHRTPVLLKELRCNGLDFRHSPNPSLISYHIEGDIHEKGDQIDNQDVEICKSKIPRDPCS